MIGTPNATHDGEVLYDSSHIAGSASTPVNYSYMSIQALSNNAWYDDCGPVTLSPVVVSPAGSRARVTTGLLLFPWAGSCWSSWQVGA